MIRVNGGGFNGYLSRRANAFGEYLVQTERGNALSVVLVDECNTAPGGSENLRAVVSACLLCSCEAGRRDYYVRMSRLMGVRPGGSAQKKARRNVLMDGG